MNVRSRRPHIFVLVFVLAAMVQFAILLAAPVRPFVDAFSGQLASVSARLVRSCGGVCLCRAAVLSNPGTGFAMEVRDGCNGANVVILLWSARMVKEPIAPFGLYGYDVSSPCATTSGFGYWRT